MADRKTPTACNESQREMVQDFYNVVTLAMLRAECHRHGNTVAKDIFKAWMHRQQKMVDEIPHEIGRKYAQQTLDQTIDMLDDLMERLLE